MKKIKAVACVLTVAMLAGIFAGCSNTTKISTNKFIKACEKMKLDYFEIGEDSPDFDDAEDGIYTYADRDMIDDDEEIVEDFLEALQIDDIIDIDDVDSFGFAAKCAGIEDAQDVSDPEDVADLELDGALAFEITLTDDGYAEDIMEFIDDKLDELGLDTKDLTKQEFLSNKKEGYIRFHIDVKKFGQLVLDNDDLMDLIDFFMDSDDFEDLVNDLSGDIAVSIEVNGSNIFVILGGSLNTKSTELNRFVSAFGAANNPMKVPMNEDVCEDIIDIAVEKVMSSFGSYSSGFDFDDYDDWDDYDEEED